ncbi:MAG: Modification methylase TaqI [Syntrophomonadaceae bacterium]|nr:Modification methylase TaqI [Bacillota bacterium]
MISTTGYKSDGVRPTGPRLDQFLEKKIWKMYGAVSTPREVVDFMIEISGVESWEGLSILEPGCGFCDFLTRIYEKHPRNEFVGLEVNPEIYEIITKPHPYFRLEFGDFLLWNTEDRYDIVIGNPPYGIIGHESHYPIHALREKKSAYKKVTSTWHGKYNIYGAFIEKGLKLLKDQGRLVFIVPATFMILDDFKLLRRLLSLTGRVKVFYLGPRVFKNKTVSTVVLVVHKGLAGIELYDVEGINKTSLCYSKDSYDGGIIRFDAPETRQFEEGPSPLSDFFAFHFAARSPEIKKHPQVEHEPKDGLVPILTGRNLHPGWIDYDRCYSGLWMPREKAPSLRGYYAFPHIVIGHTKGGKLVAAVDKRCYPWREDIHLVPRVQGLDLNAITDYLNSEPVQQYMRSLYKDITPHVTITQLKKLPLRRTHGKDGKQSKLL